MRIQHDPRPFWPVGSGHAKVHWGGTPGVGTNEGVYKGEISMNQCEYAGNSCAFRANL